jgi:hypothetical protein
MGAQSQEGSVNTERRATGDGVGSVFAVVSLEDGIYTFVVNSIREKEKGLSALFSSRCLCSLSSSLRWRTACSQCPDPH